MMPNVVRGARMGGLMTYLAGPGRSNEHTEPHLVAGDSALMTWHGDAELGRDSALAIAHHLERPRTAFDVEVKGGHVWHCSLSLRSEEGLLTDERWGAIAGDFVQAMGFDDNEGSKAPCRWVAVRHGVSANGNDHMHLVVNLVREDGTKASIHNDFKRAQDSARALEAKYGLEQLESATSDRATRGYDPAEREAQARARAQAKYERTSAKQGTPGWEGLGGEERHARIVAETRTDQPRYELARTVRGCATASGGEAEFVRRMRRGGVLVRPRYADGRTDVVTGYSVAARPEAGERPIWYGGGHLARDLTLPRLRAEWPDTPTGASDAAGEWNAARRGRRPVAPGRETQEPDPKLWEQYSADITALTERLRSVPIEDHDTWAQVARQTAGAFAAWSQRVDDPAAAAAADALAVSAQTKRAPRPARTPAPSIAGAALLLVQASRGGKGAAAELVMVRQLVKLSAALFGMHQRAHEYRRAEQLRLKVRGDLMTVVKRMESDYGVATRIGALAGVNTEAAEVLRRTQQGQVPARAAGSPVPERLEPHRPHQTTKPSRDRGAER
jgi:hypothetical protein